MIELSLNDKDYKLPENWEEVPEAKRLRVLELVFVKPESGASYHELLRELLGIPKKGWIKLMKQYFSGGINEEKRERNAEALQELLHLISWMWRSEMTKKPFESIEIDGKNFYLFEEQFKSMSFGEMTDAYIHAHSYIKQLEEGDKRLNLLLGTVCRPQIKKINEQWNGDNRITYNPFIVESSVSIWDTVPTEKKILVLVYFLGSLKEFLSYFDIFNDDGIQDSEEEYPGQGYIKNQHLLSEKGIFGNMQQTKATNVYDVFLFLEENKKDVKEQIRLQKAHDDANSN